MHHPETTRKHRAYRSLFVSCALLLTATVATAAPGESSLTITASPTFTLPLVSDTFGPNDKFDMAFGGSLGLEYALPVNLPIALRFASGYSTGGILPKDGIEVPGSLSEITFMGGASMGFSLASQVTARGFLDGGLVMGRLHTDAKATYGSARAGTGLDLRLTDALSARLDASFTYMFGLYGGFGATLGMTYLLPSSGSAGSRLFDFKTVDVKNVFPIFRSYYDENPVGSIQIANSGNKTATNVHVSFIIKQYMDAPKECAVFEKLAPGQTVSVPLYGLFNDTILSITEATKVTAEITIEYGANSTQSKTATVLVYDRNALTWDDDNKAAAFVSSKDPWVLDLSGNIAAATKDSRNAEVNENLQTAITFHEGLRAYGISYVLSPNRPFAQAVLDTAAVDSLKFPRQTLGYRAGDCADLSVLYASCFEAAGIETAFITVPGHIFMAIDLGMRADDPRARAFDIRELIAFEGRLWLPIETTMRDSGFTDVWRKGASQWREASAKGLAAIYPIHSAWKTYPPVGLPADRSTVVPPPAGAVKKAFVAELDKVVRAELSLRLATVGAVKDAKSLNARGTLYGKYGMYAEAEKDFKAAAKDGLLSAVINLGNLAFIKADLKGAYAYYQQASKQSPDNPRLLVNIARVASAMGKLDEVTATLAQVRKLDPKIADQYASLAQVGSSGTRAAEVVTVEVLWF